MIGCEKQIELPKTICYYPEFPKINNNVKTKLFNLNDREIDGFIKKLVIHKEKINILRKNNGK